MTTINSADNNIKVSAIAASDSAQNQLESNKQQKITEVLQKESEVHITDTQSKKEQAREHADLAKQLKEKADEIKRLADKIKNSGVNAESVQAVQAVKLIAEQHNITDIPIPKNASPEKIAEYLGEIAKRLELLASDHRRKADELLAAAEESARLANQLKDQVQQMKQNNEDPSDLTMKSIVARNEKFNMVFKKLGIYDVDKQYKEQIAYSEKKKALEKV